MFTRSYSDLVKEACIPISSCILLFFLGNSAIVSGNCRRKEIVMALCSSGKLKIAPTYFVRGDTKSTAVRVIAKSGNSYPFCRIPYF